MAAPPDIFSEPTTPKKAAPDDFEALAIIGRGAYGEVRLVRERGSGEILALKTVAKQLMVMKNHVHHLKAERDLLALVNEMAPEGKDGDVAANPWIVPLRYSFQDSTMLYQVLQYLPGGDLMQLLIAKDTFSEDACRFYVCEMGMALAAVHALGYCHRDLKPDNVLLDSAGHIKLTDMGLCAKVGASCGNSPGAFFEHHYGAKC